MKKRESSIWKTSSFLGGLLSLGLAQSSQALELDWSGQFWSEFNLVHNYAMGNSSATDTGGYTVLSGGNKDASFQSLFLRMRPKVIVNDNIYIKSEWWVGDPVFGVFGNSLPYSADQRQFYTTFSRGSVITAQRFWGEFITDLGTIQVGRVPLNWGLGVVWDNGEHLWSRYMTTGDSIRWIAKFGSFSFIPSVILPTDGNSVGGACTVSGGVCTPAAGTGGISDYSIILRYENLEEELEGGINVVKRLGGFTQDTAGGMLTPAIGNTAAAGPVNFFTYDIYAKKKFGQLSLGAEVPIVSGTLGNSNYSTFGVATEVDFKAAESLDLSLKAGYAPGQPSQGSVAYDTFKSFYFNPNYKLGMIMFNYQLANLGGAQTLNNPTLSPSALRSPYDNPITNATYAAISANYHPWDKWTFRPGFIYARALEGAKAGSPYFYNTWSRSLQANAVNRDQGLDLGWEFDLGITFQWDEYFQFHLDGGIYSPGNFFAFSNTANDNARDSVFALSARVGVNF